MRNSNNTFFGRRAINHPIQSTTEHKKFAHGEIGPKELLRSVGNVLRKMSVIIETTVGDITVDLYTKERKRCK